ncbi:uncharacterized protein CANTADRAFT_32018, partial [Suhomyces tanzawaensis NRRL Y-17324]
MDINAVKFNDRYVDGLGNSFSLEPEEMTLECEMTSLGDCFDFSEFKRIKDSALSTEIANNGSEMEMNDEDYEMDDIDAANIKHVGLKRGPYNYYSDAVRERFWNLVIEQGCSVYRAAKLNDICLQTAYTWKRN